MRFTFLPYTALAAAGAVALSISVLVIRPSEPTPAPEATPPVRDTFASHLALAHFSSELARVESADRLDRAMRWLSAMMTIEQEAAAAAAAAAAFPAPPSDPPAEPRPAPAPSPLAPPAIQGLVTLINERRSASGLAPLATDASLSRVAGTFARQLLSSATLSHTAPDGSTLDDRLAAAGFGGATGGEVLAGGGAGMPAAEVVDLWMASAGHRPLLMSAAFSVAGASCASDGVALRCVVIFAG